jgi:hypothetical protein
MTLVTLNSIVNTFIDHHESITGQPPHHSSQRFYELIAEMANVHSNKSADYGRSDDPFFNVRSSTEWGMPAWVGAMLRGTDKIKRLQQFAASGSLKNESAHDSFIDLANYCIIAAVLMEEEDQRTPLYQDALTQLREAVTDFYDERNVVTFPYNPNAHNESTND